MQNLSSKDTSIVTVLTHGANIKPVSLEEIITHLTVTDKTSLDIIQKYISEKGTEYMRILGNAIDSVAGVQFKSHELFSLILQLDNGEKSSI